MPNSPDNRAPGGENQESSRGDYGEPWDPRETLPFYGQVPGDGAVRWNGGVWLNVRDYARAVACVNACAGIPTELLEIMGAGGIQKASGAAMGEARVQHGEAEALKERAHKAKHKLLDALEIMPVMAKEQKARISEALAALEGRDRG